MQAATTSHPDDARDPVHAAYYRRVLHDLIDLGLDLARQVHAASPHPAPSAAAAPETAAPERDEAGVKAAPSPTLEQTTVAFDRIARAVRRTILLAQSLPIESLGSLPAAQPPGTPREAAARAAARQKIIRSVEDTIYADASPANAEALHAELRDRLDRPELEDDIRSRPVDEIIAEIRRDLGLEFANIPGLRLWKRRTPAEIAILHARAAAPPGAASHPSLTTAWPPPPHEPDAPSPNDGLQNLALHLASTRFRGK